MFEQADKQNISGLGYVQNYITFKEESALIDIIVKQEWGTDLKCRVQYCGYRYDYKNKKLDLCDRLLNEGFFKYCLIRLL